VRDYDVGRFDVEMQYASRVHVFEGAAEMHGDPQSI
jgi:hypothetical protein